MIRNWLKKFDENLKNDNNSGMANIPGQSVCLKYSKLDTKIVLKISIIESFMGN